MRKALNLSFLLMGFSFTVTQGLLIRELMVAFSGNELSVALVLGNWLVLEAIGSGLLGRLAGRLASRAVSFAILQVLFALFLPVCLYATYTIRGIAGALPGEGIGLWPIYGTTLLVLTPLALIDGAMFAFGSRLYALLTGDETLSAGRVYVLEGLGAIVGGAIFTYVLIPFLVSLQVVLILSALNTLAAGLLVAWSHLSTGRRLWSSPGLMGVLLLLVASLAFLFSPALTRVQHWATGRQWTGFDVVFSENSPYGNVTVVRREGQYTFFADRAPILTAPVPDTVFSEEIVHLPLLFVPRPRSALILGGGVGGVLHELVKYSLDQVDYAELNPLLIEAVQTFPTPLTRRELADPRVRVEPVDGRLLVRNRWWSRGQQRYDLVLVNAPYPATLQLNRFYTVEFFQQVRDLLAEEGILVIRCPGSLTYLSEELRGLNRVAYHSLGEVFPAVRPIPGDPTLWLASPSAALTTVPLDALVARWEERGLATQVLTPSHIRFRLDPWYLDWFWGSLSGTDEAGRSLINRDLHPVGLFYGLAYWNALFTPSLKRLAALVGRLNWLSLSLPLAGCSLLFLGVTRLTGRGRGLVIPAAIAATGFTGMTADLVIIFAFQTLYGHIYQWIGVLIAAFMAGLSAGGLFMTRRASGRHPGRQGNWEWSALIRVELALVLFWVLVPLVLNALYSYRATPALFNSVQGVLLTLNVAAGFLVGAQFPLANRMWLAEGGPQASAGFLYACDLAGAFLGSILVPVILIPVLGILETCLMAAVLKVCSLLLVRLAR